MIKKGKKVFSWCLLFIMVVVLSGIGNISFASGAVDIPDANLEAAIRNELGKTSGGITKEDMEKLSKLNAPRKKITDLTGLQYATNLKKLKLDGNQISDISELSG